MWEQYKKTFVRIQTVIAIVTVAMLVVSRTWQVGMTFFLVMQVGSAAGAIWGVRLRRMFFPQAGELRRRPS
jgi:hypothetical protein